MTQTAGKEIRAYGIRVLLSRHKEVRKLKRTYIPSVHGNRLWKSTWLLMDFFKKNGLPEGSRVMEIGCGWGLAGIYCAKKHSALVTCVDKDKEVFPFLDLHARVNGVEVTPMKKAFSGLGSEQLEGVDVLVGADICFWDSLVGTLRRLINRALRSGVKLVLISDPGRTTFNELGRYFEKKGKGEIIEWEVKRPRKISGKILKVGSLQKAW